LLDRLLALRDEDHGHLFQAHDETSSEPVSASGFSLD
jgi:hypothetical protein